MTTKTVDLQIVQLINWSERIIEVERTLCRIDGVKLLYVDYNNAKFTIETTLDPEEIRGALQHMFVGTSVIVSRRSDTPNSSVQHPLNIHELVEASRGYGLENVEYTQSTNIKMNYTNQPTTSRSPTDVCDSKHGGYGYANAAPSQQQDQASTSGSAMVYERYGPPLPSAPPMPKTEGEGYVYGYPSEKKYMEDDYYSGEEYVSGYPTSEKNYIEDEYYSGGFSTILLCLFYGILIFFLVISIKTE